jgi:hypothetical protein
MMRINAFTRPSLTVMGEFVIGFELENVNRKSDFNIAQITSISPSWIMEPIPDSNTEPCNLAIDETKYVYYRLKRSSTVKDIMQSPEMQSTIAIERLVLQEAQKDILDNNISLVVSSVSSVSPFYLSQMNYIAVNLPHLRKC